MSQGLTEFQQYVRSRWGKVEPLSRSWLIAVMGIGGEVSETAEEWANLTALHISVGRGTELCKKHFRDGKYPGADLQLEMGDVLHYLTVLAASYGWTLETLAAANMEKLEARDAAKRAQGEKV